MQQFRLFCGQRLELTIQKSESHSQYSAGADDAGIGCGAGGTEIDGDRGAAASTDITSHRANRKTAIAVGNSRRTDFQGLPLILMKAL